MTVTQEEVDAVRAENIALKAERAEAIKRGFWAGRSCGGSRREIEEALAALLEVE